jgi:hypothetical protein
MKKKSTLILLFMFGFAGVALLGHTPALATVDPCTQAEVDAHTCVYTGSSDLQVYVVRASAPFDASGSTIFRYTAGTTLAAQEAVKNKQLTKPSAWSYIVFSLWTKPLGSNPPGADLSLNQIPKACALIAGDHMAYKLNPGVNFTTRNSVFDLITPLGTKIDNCATESGYPTALIVTSSDCLSLVVNVPAGLINAPFLHWAHFTCDDSGVNVNVEFDECTGGVKNVACDQSLASCAETVNAVPTYNPYGYVLPPATSFLISNMGPASGVTVCTGGNNLPVYLRGNEAWWCERNPCTGPSDCAPGRSCVTDETGVYCR